MALARFTVELHKTEEKGDWLTALELTSESGKMHLGPGASPLFPGVIRA